MNDYKRGDVVTLVHKDGSTLTDRELMTDDLRVRGIGTGEMPTLRWALDNGWMISSFKPWTQLPTEPGIYLVFRALDNEDAYDTDGHEIHILNRFGNWCDVGWGNGPTPGTPTIRLAAPIDVINWIEGHAGSRSDAINEARKVFGATNV